MIKERTHLNLWGDVISPNLITIFKNTLTTYLFSSLDPVYLLIINDRSIEYLMYADDIVLCPLVIQACKLSLTNYKHFVILLILIRRQWLFFKYSWKVYQYYSQAYYVFRLYLVQQLTSIFVYHSLLLLTPSKQVYNKSVKYLYSLNRNIISLCTLISNGVYSYLVILFNIIFTCI